MLSGSSQTVPGPSRRTRHLEDHESRSLTNHRIHIGAHVESSKFVVSSVARSVLRDAKHVLVAVPSSVDPNAIRDITFGSAAVLSTVVRARMSCSTHSSLGGLQQYESTAWTIVCNICNTDREASKSLAIHGRVLPFDESSVTTQLFVPHHEISPGTGDHHGQRGPIRTQRHPPFFGGVT